MNEDRHKKILSMLCDEAIKEWQGKAARGRIAAAIVRKNNVVSIGVNNKKKTDPFQAIHGTDEYCIYHHAEIKAIKIALRLLNTKDLSFYDLYICRAAWAGDGNKNKKLVWGISKPCKGCMGCIEKYGIRKVIYSTGIETFDTIEKNK